MECLEELDEIDSYFDDIELLALEVRPANMEAEAMELNLLQRFTKAYPCSQCSFAVGQAKHKQCCACGEVVHQNCLRAKPPVGYWFCSDCAPSFAHGHSDPALDAPLHNLIRGSDSYPDSDAAMRSQLRDTYHFVRGCLIRKDEDGDRIVPPPCLRSEIISKVHEELMHMGWERTYSILRRTYYWPGMRVDVQRHC